MIENVANSDESHDDSTSQADLHVTPAEGGYRVAIDDLGSGPDRSHIAPTEEANRARQSDTGLDYMGLKRGEKDPLLNLTIKEILYKCEDGIIYVDEERTALQWRSNLPQNYKVASVSIRAVELETRAQFLRHHKNNKNNEDNEDLFSALHLIGEGIAQLFINQNADLGNAALDTADKFISQRSCEVSRGWYFGPFLGMFLISIVTLLVLYVWDSGLTKVTFLRAHLRAASALSFRVPLTAATRQLRPQPAEVSIGPRPYCAGASA